ncbi:MAG TPA: hypothetical protein DEB06_06795 [Phycisphaerales bacterium]|nr:hypothetical protein [Phycisphaerales bacterium]
MRNMLSALILGLSVASVSTAPAQPVEDARGSGYRLEEGPNEVGTLDPLVLRDAARNKELQCTVRFPTGAAEPLALVVFSHGAGGDRRAFGELSAHWASWGFVVVHPTHSDSVRLRREQGESIPDVRREMRNIVSKVDLPSRVGDARLVLDSLVEIERATGVRIDRERLAMAGHSAGALTTQIMAGVKVRSARKFGGETGPLRVGSAGDGRIKAAVVISGQGASRLLSAESWNELDLPMLVITGSKDTSMVSDETPESRRMPFDLAKPGDKFLLFIEGATHSSYQGRQPAAILDLVGENAPADIGMIVDATTSATTAFLDAYLRDDTDAKAYLTSDELERFTAGRALLSDK